MAAAGGTLLVTGVMGLWNGPEGEKAFAAVGFVLLIAIMVFGPDEAVVWNRWLRKRLRPGLSRLLLDDTGTRDAARGMGFLVLFMVILALLVLFLKP